MLEDNSVGKSFDDAIDRLNKGCERSVNFLKDALTKLLSAEVALMLAAHEVFNTPEDDRITSLAQDVEEIECAIKAQIQRMGELQ